MEASTSHCCGPQRSSLSQELTGAEWAVVEPMVPLAKHGGRKRTIDVREILNEIFYVLWTGCQWQALPKDLPPKSTVWAGVALVPISISGCGLRELAAISPRSRSWVITALRRKKHYCFRCLRPYPRHRLPTGGGDLVVVFFCALATFCRT